MAHDENGGNIVLLMHGRVRLDYARSSLCNVTLLARQAIGNRIKLWQNGDERMSINTATLIQTVARQKTPTKFGIMPLQQS